jgi:hypothetical protein
MTGKEEEEASSVRRPHEKLVFDYNMEWLDPRYG